MFTYLCSSVQHTSINSHLQFRDQSFLWVWLGCHLLGLVPKIQSDWYDINVMIWYDMMIWHQCYDMAYVFLIALFWASSRDFCIIFANPNHPLNTLPMDSELVLEIYLNIVANPNPYNTLPMECSYFKNLVDFIVCVSCFQNLLAGALWGTVFGFPLACVLTALGATNCYLLSKYFGKHYVIKYFSNRLDPINSKVSLHQFYLLVRYHRLIIINIFIWTL